MLERGHDAPAEFYDRPEIEPQLVPLWSAFWELSSERQIGMAIGPIPVSKIRQYLCEEMELEGIDYDRAKAIIRRADNAYCAMLNRRREDGPEMAEQVKFSDTEGVKRLVRGLGRDRR